MKKKEVYDDFVRYITQFQDIVYIQAQKSWASINIEKIENEIIYDYLTKQNVGVDYLNKNLCKKISNSRYEIKFASIYTHSKPRVTRHESSIKKCKGSTPSCELGDLMVIFCFMNATKKPLITLASLFQAKKIDKLDSESQRCLYDSDLKYWISKNLRSLTGSRSSLRYFPTYSTGRSRALKYLIIQDGINSYYKNVPSTKQFVSGWGHFLGSIMVSDDGMQFFEDKKNDWHRIVNDLIKVGSESMPNKKRRGSNLEEIVDHFNYFINYENYFWSTEENEGIPMMLILVRDRNFEGEY